MGNRAYLLTVEERSVTWSEDPESEVLAEGPHEIPVFWASLFVPAERQIDVYELEEDDDDAGSVSAQIPNWCTEASVARQRLRSLRMPFAKLLDEQTLALWEQWVEFLLEQKSRYFKTNAAEIWDATTPAEYEEYWADLLRAFSDPSAATLQAALKRNDLSYDKGRVNWDDREVTICKLVGAEHIRNVPWFP